MLDELDGHVDYDGEEQVPVNADPVTVQRPDMGDTLEISLDIMPLKPQVWIIGFEDGIDCLMVSLNLSLAHR